MLRRHIWMDEWILAHVGDLQWPFTQQRMAGPAKRHPRPQVQGRRRGRRDPVAVGIGLEGASTAAGGADIVAFANSAGLFAGVSLEGSYLDADSDWNALYYGSGATAKAIVLDGRYTNPGAEPIRQYLAKW